MSSFTQELTVTKKNKYWFVERAFSYHVGTKDSLQRIDVPRGFLTDFASVPRLFWIVLPPDGIFFPSFIW